MTDAKFLDFNKKFNVDDYLISKSAHWRLSLRPHQPTLGSCVLSLGRYCRTFAEMTSDESRDLKEIISFTEKHLKAAFDYDKINYIMMMMVDPHVHFHVIPRYNKAIEFSGESWTDESWPTPTTLGGTALSESMASALITKIKG